jgi:hypothetical protein
MVESSEPRERARNYLRRRRLALLLSIMGTLLAFFGPALSFAAYAAGEKAWWKTLSTVSVILIALGASLVGGACVSVILGAKCPFCGKRVEPWYYPVGGLRCPKCGRSVRVL